MVPAHKDADEELKRALQASRETAQEERTYQGRLKDAMEQSKKESEDAEAIRLAIEASLASEEHRVTAIGIGLGLQATANLVNSSLRKSEPPQAQQRLMQSLEHQDDSVPIDHVVKVAFGNDVRRLRVAWRHDECATKVFECVKTAAEDSLGISIVPGLTHTLKYYDPDGDLCSLVEDTIVDFLDVHRKQSSFKVVIETQAAPLVMVASGHGWEHEDIEDAFRIHQQLYGAEVECKENSFLMDISIATPPDTPREITEGPLEEDYDRSWSIIEVSDEAQCL
jgi:hypothetical protein